MTRPGPFFLAMAYKITDWTPTITLRILVEEGKRALQQRWTRMEGGKIEEKWENVPVVEACKTERK